MFFKVQVKSSYFRFHVTLPQLEVFFFVAQNIDFDEVFINVEKVYFVEKVVPERVDLRVIERRESLERVDGVVGL